MIGCLQSTRFFSQPHLSRLLMDGVFMNSSVLHHIVRDVAKTPGLFDVTLIHLTDRNSTGNLCKHARLCWGEEILRGADACGDLDSTRKGLDKAKKLQDGSITTAFERKGKGKVTFSHRQHTKTQTRLVMTLQLSNIPNVAWFRAEIVHWVSESHRPFSIVEDRGFRCLMKTGRPEYYLPSARTVSRDVKEVFKKARSRIAKILRVRDQVGMTRPIKLTYLLGT